MYPIISIIVNTYNGEHKIVDCLESIKKVNYPSNKLDVIIINGGSSDNTLEVLNNYSFRILSYDSRVSIGVTKNRGIKEAIGELIFFTDDDCILDKEIFKFYKIAFETKNIDFAGGPVLPYSLETYYEQYSAFAKSPILSPVSSRRYNNKIYYYLLNAFSLKENDSILDGEELYSPLGSNACYKAFAIKSIKFDENLFPGDDWDANIQIKKKGYRGIYISGAKVYHKHRTNLKGFLKHVFSYGKMRYKIYKKNKKEAPFYPYPFELLFLLSLPLFYFNFLIPIGLFTLLIIIEIPHSLKVGIAQNNCGIVLAFPFLEFIRHFVYDIGMIYGFIDYYIRRN